MKISGICFLLLVSVARVSLVAAITDPNDFAALQALKNIWSNFPPNWVGADPCGSSWVGISCTNNRVVSITLASMNLVGTLSSDIIGLAELQILDLSYNSGMTGTLPATIGSMGKLTNLILIGCGFSGPIPPSIGSLQRLVFLSLNSNNFNGGIPPSLGSLSNLYWLDLADNRLSGSIPVSTGSIPGLDWLVNAKHFHFGNNRLSSQIPFQLFHPNMTLIHLLLENNLLTGTIPSSLGLVRTLEVVRLDQNLIGGSVPTNLNNLTSLQELNLANNVLTGSFPNLNGLNLLHSVDMSNNSFESTIIPPWLPSLQSLTTIILENTQIQGSLPVPLFSLFQLQTVSMKNNQINGTLDIGVTHSSQLKLVDLRNNSINGITLRPGSTVDIILVDNPACVNEIQSYCSLPQQPNSSYSTPQADNCIPKPCSSDMALSPTCKCGYPYTGTLYFRAPSFSDFGNSTIFESLQIRMLDAFISNGLPVDSVSLSDPTRNINRYLVLNLKIFPSNQENFNHSGISAVAFMLSNQTFKPPSEFGPYYFNGSSYPYFNGVSGGGRNNNGIIIGAAVGGTVLFLLLIAAAFYAFLLKRRAEAVARNNDPFASWQVNADGGVPQLSGAKCFSLEELNKYTNGFSKTNEVGTGGYGKVYRATLPNGQLVAIKRAHQGSMQGALEFKTEIELLTRVHHKNIVGLVGFCFEKGEQMLIYEYIANGTLTDSVSGASGIRLDWTRRLRIALGAARGIQYLHELANPPIIHRDIKSNNILLDERLNAKVADFGLSKPLLEYEQHHVTTQVKGTMGYMDPEYYMTQQLTEKSDVYSFGVVLLELLTSRSPIENGINIVRKVKQVMDTTKNMYNLEEILDPLVSSTNSPRSIELFVVLALRCVQESGNSRPSMGEVVKEIENIMVVVGLNPHAESASTSSSYDGVPKGSQHPYSNESLFTNSGSYPPSDLQPK